MPILLFKYPVCPFLDERPCFPLQVRLNCLYVECLAAARRWGDAVAACDAGCRATKPRSLHRPLLGWKAACLAALGHNVNAEMTKVKEHPPETQVRPGG